MPAGCLADYVRVPKVGQVFSEGSIEMFRDNQVGAGVPAACFFMPCCLVPHSVPAEEKLPEGFWDCLDRDEGFWDGGAARFLLQCFSACILRLPPTRPSSHDGMFGLSFSWGVHLAHLT